MTARCAWLTPRTNAKNPVQARHTREGRKRVALRSEYRHGNALSSTKVIKVHYLPKTGMTACAEVLQRPGLYQGTASAVCPTHSRFSNEWGIVQFQVHVGHEPGRVKSRSEVVSVIVSKHPLNQKKVEWGTRPSCRRSRPGPPRFLP